MVSIATAPATSLRETAPQGDLHNVAALLRSDQPQAQAPLAAIFDAPMPGAAVQLPQEIAELAKNAGLASSLQQLRDIYAAADPADRAALAQNLSDLLRRDDVNQQLAETINHIHALVRDPAHPDQAPALQGGLDRSELLVSLTGELAKPKTIHQGVVCTCSVSSIEDLACRAAPAEYAREWRELALLGRTTFATGEVMVLAPDPGRDQTGGHPPGRSVTQRRYQASGMEFANGNDRYDAAQDLSIGAESYTGLGQEQYQRLYNAVFNRATAWIDADTGDKTAALDALTRHTQKHGEGVLCRMIGLHEAAHSRHVVTYLRTEGDMVIVKDPRHPEHNGGEHAIPKARFEAALAGVLVAADTLPEGDPRRNRTPHDVDPPTETYTPDPATGIIIIHPRPPKLEAASSSSRFWQEQERTREERVRTDEEQPQASPTLHGDVARRLKHKDEILG